MWGGECRAVGTSHKELDLIADLCFLICRVAEILRHGQRDHYWTNPGPRISNIYPRQSRSFYCRIWYDYENSALLSTLESLSRCILVRKSSRYCYQYVKQSWLWNYMGNEWSYYRRFLIQTIKLSPSWGGILTVSPWVWCCWERKFNCQIISNVSQSQTRAWLSENIMLTPE